MEKCNTAYCRKPVAVTVGKGATKGYCEECNDRRLTERVRVWVAEHPGFEIRDGFVRKAI